MHHERTGQMKYLGESYYHRIEYSVVNSLAAIMRKWYLNSIFQPYSYSQKLQECADGIKINTSNLRYTWRVEMKDKREYKIKRSPRWKGIGELREKYCNNKNCACNQFQEIYTKTNLLRLRQERFSLDKISLSLLYSDLDPL